MVSKPTILPEWASEDRQSLVSGQFNVVEPPDEVKEDGWELGEKPNRQWWNWFNRQTYLWLQWLNQQESYNVTTNNAGVGLFTNNGALITLDVVDRVDPSKWLRAIGYKQSFNPPVFDASAIQSNGGLSIGTPTVGGDCPILGGTNSTSLVVNGRSSLIPS
jgi:hypothetical protein